MEIVGWILHRDNTCEMYECGNPAVVLVTFDGYSTEERCNDHAQGAKRDRVGEVFRAVGL